jgi:hypothetical protein
MILLYSSQHWSNHMLPLPTRWIECIEHCPINCCAQEVDQVITTGLMRMDCDHPSNDQTFVLDKTYNLIALRFPDGVRIEL